MAVISTYPSPNPAYFTRVNFEDIGHLILVHSHLHAQTEDYLHFANGPFMSCARQSCFLRLTVFRSDYRDLGTCKCKVSLFTLHLFSGVWTVSFGRDVGDQFSQ